jgi:hypothetical protein
MAELSAQQSYSGPPAWWEMKGCVYIPTENRKPLRRIKIAVRGSGNFTPPCCLWAELQLPLQFQESRTIRRREEETT